MPKTRREESTTALPSELAPIEQVPTLALPECTCHTKVKSFELCKINSKKENATAVLINYITKKEHQQLVGC
jgi:hypothetical protein